jgi:protein O-mannosyl-transferase
LGVGRWKSGVAAAVLIVAAVAVYAGSVTAPFTFDDDAAILGNASIRSLSGALSPPERGQPVAGRPVVNLSFALNYAVGGHDPRGYHVVNIAIHIGCALLLFALLQHHLDPRLAFAAALLWIVHPLNTEAVTYVSQRTETLMALFFLLTLYANARGWRTAAVAACAAGMACKETMATAPLVVMLYDRTFVYASFGEAWRTRRGFYLALASTWVLLAVLIWSGPRWESAGFSTGITPWTYLLNQAVILVEYLKRVLWPRNLILDYGEPLPYTAGEVAVPGTIVLVLLALTVWALVKRPAPGFLAACFFVILAPTSSVIPIATEVGAERRMYLPLAAAVVLVVVALRRLPAARVALLAAAVAVPLAAAAIRRNADYQDGLRLWQGTLERWPTARAHRNYATELKRAGRGEEALVHLREAIKGHPEGRYALGYELFEQGRYLEAVAELTRFVGEYPNDANLATAHQLIGNALIQQERYGEAATHLAEAARRRPDVARNWIVLGATLAQSEQLSPAEAALRRGVSLAPRDSTARMMLGLVLAAQGRLPEATTELRLAVQLDPSNADAREHLSRIEQMPR